MSWENIAVPDVKDNENIPLRSDLRIKRHSKKLRIVKVTQTWQKENGDYLGWGLVFLHEWLDNRWQESEKSNLRKKETQFAMDPGWPSTGLSRWRCLMRSSHLCQTRFGSSQHPVDTESCRNEWYYLFSETYDSVIKIFKQQVCL